MGDCIVYENQEINEVLYMLILFWEIAADKIYPALFGDDNTIFFLAWHVRNDLAIIHACTQFMLSNHSTNPPVLLVGTCCFSTICPQNWNKITDKSVNLLVVVANWRFLWYCSLQKKIVDIHLLWISVPFWWQVYIWDLKSNYIQFYP